jgi:hypothetical protein
MSQTLTFRFGIHVLPAAEVQCRLLHRLTGISGIVFRFVRQTSLVDAFNAALLVTMFRLVAASFIRQICFTAGRHSDGKQTDQEDVASGRSRLCRV